jgi:hypothetical protein
MMITTKGTKYTKVREEHVKAFSELRVLRTTIVESFRGSRKFPVVIQTISVQKKIHRGGAEHAEKRIL